MLYKRYCGCCGCVFRPKECEIRQKLTKPIEINRIYLALVQNQVQIRDRNLLNNPLLLKERQYLFIEQLHHLGKIYSLYMKGIYLNKAGNVYGTILVFLKFLPEI